MTPHIAYVCFVGNGCPEINGSVVSIANSVSIKIINIVEIFDINVDLFIFHISIRIVINYYMKKRLKNFGLDINLLKNIRNEVVLNVKIKIFISKYRFSPNDT